MAGKAVLRDRGEIAVEMTARALDPGVCPGQGEFRRCIVIEPGALPSRHGVTGFAVGRQSCGDVVYGFRRVVVLQMTRSACRAQSGIGSGCGSFVAGHTLQRAMRSRQRKTIFVLPCILQADGPSLFRMTAFACGAKLPAVNVRMARSTSHRSCLEDRIDVTARAGHIRMHSTQLEGRVVVIELRKCADRLPACRSVAFRTRHRQWAVRICRARRRRLGICGYCPDGDTDKCDKDSWL